MRYSREILTWVLGLALALPLSPVQAGNTVPVFLWGDDASIEAQLSAVNPLRKTSQLEFEKIVTKILGGSQKPILVFVRDNLCAEDFNQHKEALKHLKKGSSSVYLPSVDTPLSIFENLPSYNRTSEEDPETVSDGQLIMTKATDLEDLSEPFNMIKESNPNIIAALTGKTCGYSRPERSRRAAEEPVAPNASPSVKEVFFINKTRIILYASAPPALNISNDKDITTVLMSTTEEGNGTVESPLQLNFEYSVKNGSDTYKSSVLMRFPVKVAGYYSPEVLYKIGETNHTLKSSVDTSFPYNFSYHCSQIVQFGNESFVGFNIADFQVQIDAKNFGDAYDCVGFTSIPIWAGIFVTAILAIIMTWGLTMIMDIRTMDRFDDPKGKTITISAAE